jgi:hypothetical protein
MRTRTLSRSCLSSDQAHALSGERIVKGLDYVSLATDSCNGVVGVEWAAG